MKLKITLLAATMLLLATVNSHAASFSTPVTEPTKVTNELTPEQKARIEAIEKRVTEIKQMDKSSLTKAERKALKKELKDMKKEAKAIGGGIYLSVGAIIVIILLLILLL
ncbi:MAG: hypothetical protein EOO14_02465 [Chitinophagaceae bacterium]|nr:MAG: hypothetical protein EOO14_02465 [Chitinophagaceae bacterium]